MRAVGYQEPRPIADEASLVDIELPRPTATGRDLLVEVRAVSVNPVDTKVRKSAKPEPGDWKVLGWDAAGVVVEAGPEASLFKPGDAVFYAGAIGRPGSNAEFHLVDERIVGHKPASLGWSEAAAMPLTAITAWETLFDRMDVRRAVPGAPVLLVVGGAGGVGSITIQLARTLTDLTVIATASRPETREWVRGLGAQHVIDHRQPMAGQIAALGVGAPGFVFCTTNTLDHAADIAELIAPQGRMTVIDEPAGFDIMLFKRKSVSINLELMYTRSIYGTADMAAQGELLNEVARMVDAGTLRTTHGEHFGRINAGNLRRAHALIESGRAMGKITLEGFGEGA